MRKWLILAGGVLYMSVLGGATAWAQTAPAQYLPAILFLLLDGNSPTISITGLGNPSTFGAPANITVLANASDSDGTIVRVEFYAGSSLIAIATTAVTGNLPAFLSTAVECARPSGADCRRRVASTVAV